MVAGRREPGALGEHREGQDADGIRPAHSHRALVLQCHAILALRGDAKRKYFEHAGALMTADGSEDKKIKLESTPQGYKLTIPEPVPA